MRDQAAVSAMLCPVCHVGLAMTDRQGVEIDYCPQCRGVWLDRGELDKIIERSAGDDSARPLSGVRLGISDDRGHGDHGGKHGYERGHKGRRKSFFSELFD